MACMVCLNLVCSSAALPTHLVMGPLRRPLLHPSALTRAVQLQAFVDVGIPSGVCLAVGEYAKEDLVRTGNDGSGQRVRFFQTISSRQPTSVGD